MRPRKRWWKGPSKAINAAVNHSRSKAEAAGSDTLRFRISIARSDRQAKRHESGRIAPPSTAQAGRRGGPTAIRERAGPSKGRIPRCGSQLLFPYSASADSRLEAAKRMCRDGTSAGSVASSSVLRGATTSSSLDRAPDRLRHPNRGSRSRTSHPVPCESYFMPRNEPSVAITGLPAVQGLAKDAACAIAVSIQMVGEKQNVGILEHLEITSRHSTAGRPEKLTSLSLSGTRPTPPPSGRRGRCSAA